jgi:hypothetical protein
MWEWFGLLVRADKNRSLYIGNHTGYKLVKTRVGQNRICTPYMAVCVLISLLIIPKYTVHICVCMGLANSSEDMCTHTWSVGLARTVYMHRIWPYILWFPCQKYRVYTVYIYGSGQPYWGQGKSPTCQPPSTRCVFLYYLSLILPCTLMIQPSLLLAANSSTQI